MNKTAFLSLGHYVPPKVVTNKDLEKMMDTTDEWIQQRTGIQERRYVEEGMGNIEMSYEATQMALQRAGLKIQDIDFIILGTLSPDYSFPGTACFLQEKLGIPNIPALDIRQQCTGFIYGLSIADQYIKTGMYQKILLVGTEVHSTGIEFATRGRDVAVLFGDGAGAAILGAVPENEKRGVLSTHLHADGRFAKELWVEAPSSRQHPRMTHQCVEEGSWYPKMNGRSVFVTAVKKFEEVIGEALDHNKVQKEDVCLFVFHQANLRIVQNVCEKMKIPMEKTFNNIQKYGNTTAASIPLALSEAWEAGRIKKNDLVCLCAFGSGYTWASALVRW
ncbi:MAG: ketoacyl-ACP synthase III [Deltaproteobacteria bacterium]|nr:ketoacyl-ACP synthase III [Deltaproteobacteria bacterium]